MASTIDIIGWDDVNCRPIYGHAPKDSSVVKKRRSKKNSISITLGKEEEPSRTHAVSKRERKLRTISLSPQNKSVDDDEGEDSSAIKDACDHIISFSIITNNNNVKKKRKKRGYGKSISLDNIAFMTFGEGRRGDRCGKDNAPLSNDGHDEEAALPTRVCHDGSPTLNENTENMGNDAEECECEDSSDISEEYNNDTYPSDSGCFSFEEEESVEMEEDFDQSFGMNRSGVSLDDVSEYESIISDGPNERKSPASTVEPEDRDQLSVMHDCDGSEDVDEYESIHSDDANEQESPASAESNYHEKNLVQHEEDCRSAELDSPAVDSTMDTPYTRGDESISINLTGGLQHRHDSGSSNQFDEFDFTFDNPEQQQSSKKPVKEKRRSYGDAKPVWTTSNVQSDTANANGNDAAKGGIEWDEQKARPVYHAPPKRRETQTQESADVDVDDHDVESNEQHDEEERKNNEHSKQVPPKKRVYTTLFKKPGLSQTARYNMDSLSPVRDPSSFVRQSATKNDENKSSIHVSEKKAAAKKTKRGVNTEMKAIAKAIGWDDIKGRPIYLEAARKRKSY